MKRLMALALLAAFLLPVSVSAGVYEDMLTAVKMNDITTVGNLLQRGVDVNTSDALGNSLLMLAAENGNLPILELLLRKKAKVLTRNRYGDSALMVAALRGHPKATAALVAAGAEIDPDGWTPLIYAAFGGHVETVRFLLSLEVDVDAQADNGMTALMVASRNGHLEVVKVLLEYDADATLVAQDGLTASDMATRAGNTEIAMKLARAEGR